MATPRKKRATSAPKNENANLRLEYRKASDLASNPRNYRAHPKKQLTALRDVIAEVGWAGVCLYNEKTQRLIDGHARKDISGDELVPVLIGSWTTDQEKKILATLDPLAAMATANTDALDSLLREVQTGSEAVGEMLKDIGRRAGTAWAKEQDAVVEDEVPEAPKKAISKPGDLWLLGEHRLLCGDSTKEEDVRRVMGGERAGLMNTDPPYGVVYANDDRPNPGVAKPRVAKPRVAKDELQDEELQAFLESAFRAACAESLKQDAAWYLWHAHLTQGFFAAAAAAANVVLHRQIIWVKPVLLLTRGQYHWKHEPCFMGWVRGQQPPDYGRGNGERDQTTVWEIDAVKSDERKEFNHSTPKPVALFSGPIIKHLKEGEIAYEPFAGSGPQIIAAEQLKRRCFAIEIEPRYVDVCVARWEKFTGKKAKRET